MITDFHRLIWLTADLHALQAKGWGDEKGAERIRRRMDKLQVTDEQYELARQLSAMLELAEMEAIRERN
jgi:hypothetical protein